MVQKKISPIQETCINEHKDTIKHNKHVKTEMSLDLLYVIWPANVSGLFLQPMAPNSLLCADGAVKNLLTHLQP